MNIDAFTVLTLALDIIALLISITLHEVSHGYASYRFGDNTAKAYGRLSLNPFAHINPAGFALLVVIMFMGTLSGGSSSGFVMSMLSVMVCFSFAKPVPVGGQGLKNPIRDMAVIAAAGPITNLIVAFISLIAYKYSLLWVASMYFDAYGTYFYNIAGMLTSFFAYLAQLNIGLAVFNLVPIPPLDGSKILYAFLPKKILFFVVKYERYITMALFVLLVLNVLDYPINMAGNFIIDKMLWVVDLLPPRAVI